MILSVIVATKGRKDELEALLESISGYDLSLIEVLIIDQNVSNFLVEIINKFESKFKIKHIKIDPIGASNARNVGIENSSGQYLCFPDDDCKFLPDTIKIALEKILDYDVIFGKCVDEKGANSVTNFAKGEDEINYDNYSNRFVEATMFAKREIMLEFPYDENLGVGTFHGAEEAFDLVLRLLQSKKKLFYTSEVIYYHPNKILDYSSKSELKRVFSYRCGFAKLCFKHGFYFKYFKRIVLVSLSLPFYALFNQKKARYYSAELLGLLTGVIIK
jgi:glycosyltransferase involved in cell wall biosynthesis